MTDNFTVIPPPYDSFFPSSIDNFLVVLSLYYTNTIQYLMLYCAILIFFVINLNYIFRKQYLLVLRKMINIEDLNFKNLALFDLV